MYLSHLRSAKAQASLRMRTVSPEPSLLAYIQFGFGLRLRQKLGTVTLLDSCACEFEECVSAYAIRCHYLKASPIILSVIHSYLFKWASVLYRAFIVF